MTQILLLVGAGMAAGCLFPALKKYKEGIGRLQNAVLYLMVFFLGASVGVRRELMAMLPQIGLRAALIAVLCLLFSVLSVWGAVSVAGRLFSKNRVGEEGQNEL